MAWMLLGAALTLVAALSIFGDLGWQLATALSLNIALLGTIFALYRIVIQGKRNHGKAVAALRDEIASIRREAKWDEDALLVAYDEGRIPDYEAKRRKTPPTLKFWLYARNPLSQPNRIRLWFTGEPKSAMVHLYAKDRGNPVTIGRNRGSIKIDENCLEIEYMAPPLSTSPPSGEGAKVGELSIWVRADKPIDIVKTAAYTTSRR